MTTDSPLPAGGPAADRLTTVASIAAYRDEKPRRTSHLLERGLIPGWKTGGVWESTKSVLDRHRRELEAEALERVRRQAARHDD